MEAILQTRLTRRTVQKVALALPAPLLAAALSNRSAGIMLAQSTEATSSPVLAPTPECADNDVATFKSLQAFRNRIHGERIDEEEAEQFQRDAISLLRRYAHHYLNL